MDYVTFGRTGLRASVMGLGCGGASRIGQNTDKSEAESIAITFSWRLSCASESPSPLATT